MMSVCSPISTCAKNVVYFSGSLGRQMSSCICNAISSTPSSSFCFYLVRRHPKLGYTSVGSSATSSSCSPIVNVIQRGCFRSNISKKKVGCHSLTLRSVFHPRRHGKTCIDVSLGCQDMNLMLLVPRQTGIPKIKCNVGPFSWQQCGVSAGLFIGMFLCFSTSESAHAEAPKGDESGEGKNGALAGCYSHGKKVYTDYSVIGIPGDGRCMFRSVAHGACIRSGKSAPSERQQRELADELRARVADEFIKRREETEWFIEGDFDTYVSQIRKPHVWGGEPELLMASHVLQMPITVYMYDEDSGGLISIAEYGQEYGTDNPILVLYHGFGHYDALQIPGKGGVRPRL